MRKTALQRLKEGQQPQKAWYNTQKAFERLTTRLTKRISWILIQPHKYFITFTIAPGHEGLSIETYARKKKEALSQASCYVSNKDYGDLNGRLHFHAIASFDVQQDYTTGACLLTSVWKYGRVQIDVITVENEKSLREYISKQVNHATKDTAHKIWYSRGWKDERINERRLSW